MKSKPDGKYILSLEAGLAGGSVSVFCDEECIDSCEGAKELSRSEDLLLLVEKILIGNNLKKREITAIIVADGPGSLTGVRICLATAKGLSDAFEIPLYRFSILDAVAISAGVRGELTATVFSEKSGLYVRDYKFADGSISPAGEIFLERDVPGFLESLEHAEALNKRFVFHADFEAWINKKFNKSFLGKPNIIVISGHYAAILAAAAMRPITLGL